MNYSMKTLTVSTIVVAAFIFGGALLEDPSNEDVGESSPYKVVSEPQRNHSVVPAGVASHKWIVQTAEYVRSGEGAPADSVIIETKEQDSGSGRWFYSSTQQWVSFDVKLVRARIANDLFVLGERNGATILERWLISPPKGGFNASRAIASTAIGVPYPGGVATTTIVQGGGAWIPPDERKPKSQGMKLHTLLQRGGNNPIRTFEVDPDGRFVLFADNQGLRQLDLSAPSGTVPSIIFPWSALDSRAQMIDSFVVKHSSLQGRVFIGTVNSQAVHVDYNLILVDADNDGVFEGVQELPYAQYRPAFPRSEWQDEF